MTRDELLAISREPNVAAFLRALRLGEGTRDEDGYRRIVGGSHFQGFADHPRTMVALPNLSVNSSAAGAYQFLARTWDGLVRQYAFPDFSPPWQDAGAVGLIIGRKALDAVRVGRIREAITLCNREWASLPGSPYGQRTEALDRVLLEYRKWGGTLTDDSDGRQAPAPIDNSRSREAAPEDTPMLPLIPIIAAVLPSIISAIPQLGKIFGSGSEVSQRNIEGATRVLEAVTQATGSVNALEAAEKIAADPVMAAAAQAAVQAIWFELVEAGGGGIDGARKADAVRQSDGWIWYRSVAFLSMLLLLPLVYMAALAVFFPAIGGDWPSEVRASALMMTLGIAVSIGAYAWGSSNKPSVPGK